MWVCILRGTTFFTAWFTIRYRKSDFRNLKSFSLNITWPVSFGLGVMITVIAGFINLLNSDSFKYLAILIIGIPTGWMVANSKRHFLNLFMLQLSHLFFITYIEFTTSHNEYRLLYEHMAVLIAIIIGSFICKINKARLQAS